MAADDPVMESLVPAEAKPADAAWYPATGEREKRICRRHATSTVAALYTRGYAITLSRGGEPKRAKSHGTTITRTVTRCFRILLRG